MGHWLGVPFFIKGQQMSVFLKKLILLSAALGFLIICPWDASGGQRRPNRYEDFYQEIALSFNEPGLCQKIAPDAVLSAAFTTKGFQISSVRSKCFYNIALKYNTPAVCEQVKPVAHFFLDGSKISVEGCRQTLLTEGAVSNMSTYFAEDIVGILQEMGYTPDKISQEEAYRVFVKDLEYSSSEDQS